MRDLHRRNGRAPLNAEINITNLVDVAFVLLIIFVITAPILQGGVEVDLPQGDAAPITSAEAVIVSVTRDGDVFVGDVPVASLDEFESVYRQVLAGKHAREAYLKGDAGAPYGDVYRVLGLMKRLDVVEVGLVGIPELEPQ